MAQFITRVELHGATEHDYINLHNAMAREGFSRLIADDRGINYHLPTAEYNFIGYTTLANVFVAAQRAANSTGRNSWILITESAGITWQLLQAR